MIYCSLIYYFFVLEFENDDDDDELGDVTQTAPGRNGCHGLLAIVHSLASDPSGDLTTRTFAPASYRNTERVFRRRSIQIVEVSGTCSWRLYPQRRFRGTYTTLTSGFRSHVRFTPLSIAQIE